MKNAPVTSGFDRSKRVGFDLGFDRDHFRPEVGRNFGFWVDAFDGLLDCGDAMSAGYVFYGEMVHRKSPLIRFDQNVELPTVAGSRVSFAILTVHISVKRKKARQIREFGRGDHLRVVVAEAAVEPLRGGVKRAPDLPQKWHDGFAANATVLHVARLSMRNPHLTRSVGGRTAPTAKIPLPPFS